MSHIFISYSHKDKYYVHNLQKALQNEGFDAWIDDRIDYGDQWLKVIQKHLDQCDAFIIVMSQSSFESEMVQNEITRALAKKKHIFPVLLEGEHWLSVQAKQYVDVTDRSLPTEKFYKRLEAVTPRKKKVVVSSPPPPPPKPPTARRPLISKDAFSRFKAQIVPAGRWAGAVLLIGMVLWAGSLAIPVIDSWIPTATKAPPGTTVSPTVNVATPVTKTKTASPSIPPSVTTTRTVTVSGSIKTSPIDGARMERIPASGNVESFWIDQSAVTTSMFEKFVNATDYVTDAEKSGVGFVWTNLGEQPATQFPGQTGVVFEWKLISGVDWKNPVRDEWRGDGDQVVQVSWNDAVAYCQWAGRELVTSDEWELALASGSSVVFYNSRAGVGEWGENRTTGVYRIVLGYRDVQWGFNSIFPERGFVEYRSANILTFRCKEKS